MVISVLGTDRPGIVATVSTILFENGCNIEDVSQTILQNEFAAIFLSALPEGVETNHVLEALRKGLHPLGLEVLVKTMETRQPVGRKPSSEPFVVTTLGSDRLGLVAGVTEVMARFRVNITNLKAVFRGGDDPHRNVMIYEVDIPVETDFAVFREALGDRARDLGLDLNLQHRDIFEAIHRI